MDMNISLDINGVTLVIQIVATILLFAVVGIFFAKPMKNFIAKRQAFVQASFNEAEEAKLEASKTKKELDEELAKFNADSRQMMEEASLKAQVKSNAIIADAQVQAGQVMDKAEKKIKRDRDAMIKDAQAEIADITTKATAKLIKKEIDASVHDDLFDEFVKLVGGDHE